MTDRHAASRPLVTPRYVAVRVAATAAVIGAAAAWPLLHGAGAPAIPLPPVRLHAPRLELLAAAPAVIRLHVASAVTAFLVGTALLIGVKGTALHRTLGWVWVAAMMTTALGSFFIKVIDPGHWSFIHFLSGWVAVSVPMGVVAIRRRNVKLHRRIMTGQFVGGLVIAGAFTFVPGRLMWQVFFG